MSHPLSYTYSMKIEITEEQYDEIRTALIIARCELESSLEDLKRKNSSCLAKLTSERLVQINTALDNSSFRNLKISH